MIDYALLTLKCWSCEQGFQHFTDLSNHHLAAHEQSLNGEPASAWLAQELPPEECYICHNDPLISPVCSRCAPTATASSRPLPPLAQEVEDMFVYLTSMPAPAPLARCTCGCVYEVHHEITAELPLQPCGQCTCRAFVLALKQETPPLASPLRWMWQTGGTGYHDSAHTETPGCINAGCVPTGRTVCDEP